ncbi:MAG: hypothetical protein M3040_03030 [Bacteroidota bacterium]|nr:hypothetical protein [Bacteroidota bacterium]
MKKLLVILFSLGVALGAAAQPKIGGFRGGSYGGAYVRPRVTVIAPVAPIYPYYGYGYGLGYGYGSRFGFGYSPFNDPFYNQRRVEERPSQLDLQIEDIKNEYGYKIDNVKDDKSLTKDERKQKVRDLKHEKDKEIIDAKKNYYEAKDKDAHTHSDSEGE